MLSGQPDCAQALRQVDGNLVQQRQVALVLGQRRRQVFAVEIKACAQGMFITARRRHVALRTHHGAQRPAAGGGGQAGNLPPDTLERQLRARLETPYFGGTGQNHHGRAGNQAVTRPGLPLLVDLAQLQHFLMGDQPNPWVLQLLLAQRRWVHPAAFGVEQPAGRQGHAGDGFSFCTFQRVQQVGVESGSQLALALSFLVVEGQLQHAAGIPVAATLQAFKLAPGVAETGQDHL
ncbi:hypothetical protein D3C80_1035540 [compost metagenome]